MELKEFISKTLQEVLQGINEAQNELAGKNIGTVVPFTVEGQGTLKPPEISPYQNIKFEVAVNIEEKSGSGASISVLSALVNGKIQGNSANANTHASKISFVVPVYYAERMVNS